jgi:hypothetical protein
MTKTQRFHFLPVFVHINPPATIFETEQYINYPHFKDRYEEHWAIVPKECVVETDDKNPYFFVVGNVNIMKPALVVVDIQEAGEDLWFGWLGDLDQKYIAANPQAFLNLTLEEARTKLNDIDWVIKTFGRPANGEWIKKSENNQYFVIKPDGTTETWNPPKTGQVAVNLNEGLFKEI